MVFVFSGVTSVTSLFNSNEYILMPLFPVTSEHPSALPHLARGISQLLILSCGFLFFSFFFSAGDNKVFLTVLQHNCKYTAQDEDQLTTHHHVICRSWGWDSGRAAFMGEC